MKIQKDTLKLILSQFFIFIITEMTIYFYNNDYKLQIFYLAIIGVINVVIFLLFSIKNKLFQNIPLIIVLYLFTYGQIFLKLFLFSQKIYLETLFNNFEILKAAIYTLKVNSLFLTSVLICSNIKFKTKAKEIKESKEAIRIGIKYLLLIFGLPGILATLYLGIIIYRNGYYYVEKLGRVSTHLMTLISILGTLLIYKKLISKKESSIYYLFGFFCFLFGGRSFAVSIIISFLYIDFVKKEINIKHKIIFGLMIILIPMVAMTRIERKIDITIITKAITLILSETGHSMIPLLYVQQLIPKKLSYSYGASFIDTILKMVPGFIRQKVYLLFNLKENIDGAWLTQVTKTNYGLGFSFPAEVYSNFGNKSIIFPIIVGVVIGLMLNIKNKSLVKIGFVASLFPILLTFPRRELSYVYVLIWYFSIFPYFFIKIIEKYKKNSYKQLL